MEAPTIADITLKLRNAKGLKSFFNEYTTKVSNFNTDKYGAKFVVNRDRQSMFRVNIAFESYLGSYGDSSVYSFNNGVSTDKNSREMLRLYFIRAINNDKVRIFESMALLMQEDADAAKADALVELEEYRKLIEGE
jgi:hypothetical protein